MKQLKEEFYKTITITVTKKVLDRDNPEYKEYFNKSHYIKYKDSMKTNYIRWAKEHPEKIKEYNLKYYDSDKQAKIYKFKKEALRLNSIEY